MSQMQQDSSETLGFACEFAHYDFFQCCTLILGEHAPLPVPTAMVMEVRIIELSKDQLTGRWKYHRPSLSPSIFGENNFVCLLPIWVHGMRGLCLHVKGARTRGTCLNTWSTFCCLKTTLQKSSLPKPLLLPFCGQTGYYNEIGVIQRV